MRGGGFPPTPSFKEVDMRLYMAIKAERGVCNPGDLFDFTEDGMEKMNYRISEKTGAKIPTSYTGLILPWTTLVDLVVKLPSGKGEHKFGKGAVDPAYYGHKRN